MNMCMYICVCYRWDLTQFPFDKQILRMTLPLLDPGQLKNTG